MCRVSISDFRPKSVMTHNDSSVSPKKILVFFACTVFPPLSDKPSLESVPITELKKVRVKGLSQVYTLTLFFRVYYRFYRYASSMAKSTNGSSSVCKQFSNYFATVKLKHVKYSFRLFVAKIKAQDRFRSNILS